MSSPGGCDQHILGMDQVQRVLDEEIEKVASPDVIWEEWRIPGGRWFSIQLG